MVRQEAVTVICPITTRVIITGEAAPATTTATAIHGIIRIIITAVTPVEATAIIRARLSRRLQGAILLHPAAVLPVHRPGRQDNSGQTGGYCSICRQLLLYILMGGMDNEFKT